MTRIPLKTVYNCQYGRGTDYTSLAFLHDTLTLDRSFIRHRFGITNRTSFTEIKIVPFSDVLSVPFRRLMNVKRTVQESKEGLCERIRVNLKNFIGENWVPSGNHAILHSSGLDSRCLSWLIRELYHERGPDWLGTIIFCCSKWESDSFRDIMTREGWEPHQYHVPNEGATVGDYYAPSLLNFRDAWQWSDGAIPIAVNLFWYPVTSAIGKGLLPDDLPIQTFTGQWGNTVLDAGSSQNGPKSIHNIVEKFYNSILCQRPMYGDELHPYAQVELAKIVCESSVVMGKALRPALAEYIDPTLATFTNLAADGDRHRRIADWVIAQMRYDYASSWYGQNICNAKPAHRTTEFQDWYYHWTLASFCDELRRRGIAIQ